MPKCHDFKKDDVYSCQQCKLEMKVTRECECDASLEVCACHTQPGSCVFNCCNEEMKKVS